MSNASADHSSNSVASLISAGVLLWAAITLCAVGLSRPILHGWFHDPTLRFAGIAFVLWLLATVLQWRRLPEQWPISRTLWVVLASALLCLGIIGELQAFIYLAAALLLVVPLAGSWPQRLAFMLSSCVWMPALAWLLSPLLGASLPWLTLLVAAALFVYSLKQTFLPYAP
jgi:hypothetical protein